jgi:hypothetical protein
MNRIALRFGFAGAIVVASLATPLLIQRHVRTLWHEGAASSRHLEARLAALSAENERLSNHAARTRSALSGEQLRELLRLRGEIGQLLEGARELARLQAAHQGAIAAFGSSKPQSGPSLPASESTLAYWPKAQLSSAGYADPISGLQTALFAMSRDDPNALAASVVPESWSQITNQYEGSTPAERLAAGTRWVADSLAPASGFYVVGQTAISNDRTVLDVYFQGEGGTRGFGLKNVAGEWKLDGIYEIEESNDHPLGVRFWP